MGIKTYNPYTPSRRQMTGSDFSEITKTTPEKSLLESKKRKAGRNAQGKITVRHRGGGAKKKYRIIDFKRKKDGIPATVVGIEYDPNRSANIALICYADGEKAYILAPEGLTDGMTVMNGAGAEVRVGNCLPLSEIPVGTQIHNPSRRQMTGSDFSEITKTTPEKSLLESKKRKAGRNAQGKITVRHRGGGAKKKYRIIDFKRKKDGIPATVVGIEYDPNRSANIALICYADGEKAYILAPEGLTDGMTVMNGAGAEVRVGNCLPLSEIPVGTQIHNIELYPGKGGQLVRSAGNSAQLMAKEGKYATLRLPSGEMRMVPIICRASIGVVGNGDHNLINVGKAGRKRHMGIRPTVRGSVMNPNDHPHGGGEGKTSIGRPGPCTPWGKPALGLKTRKKNKSSNKLIVRRRDGKAIK